MKRTNLISAIMAFAILACCLIAPPVWAGALSADKTNIAYAAGDTIAGEVYRSTTLWLGSLCMYNSTGYVIPGADTASCLFAGVNLDEKIDNASGDDGDEEVALTRNGVHKMTFATAISQATVGDPVFLVDDQTVDIAANVSNYVWCGTLVGYISATQGWVDIGSATARPSALATEQIADEAVTVAKMADLARGSILSGQTASNRPAALNAKADGNLLIGNGNDLASVAMTGDVTITNAGVTAIGAKKVTAAMTAIADGKVLIGGAGGAGAEQTLTGDVTVTNAGVTAIGAGKVTAAMTAIADGKVLIGGAGGAGAEQTLTGDVTVTNAGVTAIGAGKVTAAMTAIADGKVLIGGAGGAGAEQTLTGDVTVTNAGVTAIGAGKVTSSMMASGAGVAALIANGLGASAAYIKTTVGAQTLLASDVAARVALIIVVVDESFADGDGGQAAFTIGETDGATKYTDGSDLVGATAGDIKVYAGTLTAAKNLLVTGTAATGTGTGGISVTALVLPAAP